MTKYRVGIIGLGVGEKHIKGYQRHERCNVVALCDFSEEKLRICGKKFPHMKITKDADEILLDPAIDIISVATYDNYHYEQIVKALSNGKHVFVEKPLCLYEDEAVKIRALLRENPHIKLSSNLILRMTPRFRLLKNKIENKELGELYYLESDYNYGRLNKITEGWRGEMPYYSVVYGGGVHVIDLLLWLTGDDVEEVFSYGNNIASKHSEFKYNDFVVTILKFKKGLNAKVACNMGCVYPHFHTLCIYGTEATFINDFEHGVYYKSRDPKVPPKIINEAYPGTQKGDLLYNFVESIIDKVPLIVSTDDVFKTMSVCFAIEKAVNGSGPVKVNYI